LCVYPNGETGGEKDKLESGFLSWCGFSRWMLILFFLICGALLFSLALGDTNLWFSGKLGWEMKGCRRLGWIPFVVAIVAVVVPLGLPGGIPSSKWNLQEKSTNKINKYKVPKEESIRTCNNFRLSTSCRSRAEALLDFLVGRVSGCLMVSVQVGDSLARDW